MPLRLPMEGGAGTYLDWGVVHISLTNFLIIVLMVVVFVAALLIPFPHGSQRTTTAASSATGTPDDEVGS